MTDHTTTRATPLRRVGCALTIALALGLGLAGTASAATPLNPGVNDIAGKLGADAKTFACPAGLGIQDVKTSSAHSNRVETTWGLWNNEPLQLGITLRSAPAATFFNKWYHVTLRCEGPITDTQTHNL